MSTSHRGQPRPQSKPSARQTNSVPTQQQRVQRERWVSNASRNTDQVGDEDGAKGTNHLPSSEPPRRTASSTRSRRHSCRCPTHQRPSPARRGKFCCHLTGPAANQRPMSAGSCRRTARPAWLPRAPQPVKLCVHYKRLQCRRTVCPVCRHRLHLLYAPHRPQYRLLPPSPLSPLFFAHFFAAIEFILSCAADTYVLVSQPVSQFEQ